MGKVDGDPDTAVVTDTDIRINVRNLFVPYHDEWDEKQQKYVTKTAISWEAQIEHATKLFRQGYSVRVHRHGWGSTCEPMSSPNGGCVYIDLTEDEDSTRLVPVIDEDEDVLESGS